MIDLALPLILILAGNVFALWLINTEEIAMDYALFIGGALVVAGAVWLLLCKLGVIPEPWSKWSIAVIVAIGTLGVAAMVSRAKKKKAAASTKVVVEKGPTKKELDDKGAEISSVTDETDKQEQAHKEATTKAEETDDALTKIDGAEEADLDTVDGGVAVDGPTAERLRRLHEKLGEGSDLP